MFIARIPLAFLLTFGVCILCGGFTALFVSSFDTHLQALIKEIGTKSSQLTLQKTSIFVEAKLNSAVRNAALLRESLSGVVEEFPELTRNISLAADGFTYENTSRFVSVSTMSLLELTPQRLESFQEKMLTILAKALFSFPFAIGGISVESFDRWRISVVPKTISESKSAISGAVTGATEIDDDDQRILFSWVPNIKSNIPKDVVVLRNCSLVIPSFRSLFVPMHEDPGINDSLTHILPALLSTDEATETTCSRLFPIIVEKDINHGFTQDVTNNFSTGAAQNISQIFPMATDFLISNSDFSQGAKIPSLQVALNIVRNEAKEQWSRMFVSPLQNAEEVYFGYVLPLISSPRPNEEIITFRSRLASISINFNLNAFASSLAGSNSRPTEQSSVFIVAIDGSVIASAGADVPFERSLLTTAEAARRMSGPNLDLRSCINNTDGNVLARSRTPVGMTELLCPQTIKDLPNSESIQIVWDEKVYPQVKNVIGSSFQEVSEMVKNPSSIWAWDVTFVAFSRPIAVSAEPQRRACQEVGLTFPLIFSPAISRAAQSCELLNLGRDIPWLVLVTIPGADVLKTFIQTEILIYAILSALLLTIVLVALLTVVCIIRPLHSVGKRIETVARTKDQAYAERLSMITEVRAVQQLFMQLVEKLRESTSDADLIKSEQQLNDTIATVPGGKGKPPSEREVYFLQRNGRNMRFLGVGSGDSGFIVSGVACLRISIDYHRVDVSFATLRELLPIVFELVGPTEESGVSANDVEGFVYAVDHSSITVVFFPADAHQLLFPLLGSLKGGKCTIADVTSHAVKLACIMNIKVRQSAVISGLANIFYTIDTDAKSIIDVHSVDGDTSSSQSVVPAQGELNLQFLPVAVFSTALDALPRISTLQIQRLRSAILVTDRAAHLMPSQSLSTCAPVDCVELYCSSIAGDAEAIQTPGQNNHGFGGCDYYSMMCELYGEDAAAEELSPVASSQRTAGKWFGGSSSSDDEQRKESEGLPQERQPKDSSSEQRLNFQHCGAFVCLRMLLYEVDILSKALPGPCLQQFQQGFRMLLAGNYSAAGSFLEDLSTSLTKIGRSFENGSRVRDHRPSGVSGTVHESVRETDASQGDSGSTGDDVGYHGGAAVLKDVMRMLNHIARWKRIAAVSMTSRSPYVRKESRRWEQSKAKTSK